MAQEGYGRLFQVVPVASGVAINLALCAAIGFYGTNDDTFTLTLSTSFGGSYAQPSGWNPITHCYTETSNGAGTSVWTRVTQSASNAVVTATDIGTYFELMCTAVPDTYNYVKCTATHADGVLVAVLHDLSPQRSMANLPKVSA